jgi:hypothetical protein
MERDEGFEGTKAVPDEEVMADVGANVGAADRWAVGRVGKWGSGADDCRAGT